MRVLFAIPNSVLDLPVPALGVPGAHDLLPLLAQPFLGHEAVEAERGADQAAGHEARRGRTRLVGPERGEEALGAAPALGGGLVEGPCLQRGVGVRGEECGGREGAGEHAKTVGVVYPLEVKVGVALKWK